VALAALALACVAVAPSASAAVRRSDDTTLSSRLAELAQPSVRSASRAKQAKLLGLPVAGPGSLLRDGNRVLVEVRFERAAASAVDRLRGAGAEIVDLSRRYQTVTVAAKPGELSALSDVSRIAAATEVLTPVVSTSTCPSGAVVSEGDVQLHAKEERETPPEFDGAGVTVGILSDSFDRATEAANGSGPVATHKSDDVANGDLPGFANTCAGQSTPVEVLSDPESEGEDEGRAMAQIVHDLAPGANLAFATAFAGETAFAESIEELAKTPAEEGAGADVVVDDVSYPGEPFFQEGPIAVAVRHATEAGATYFSAAGNNSAVDLSDHQIGSWEAAQYRSSGSCPPALQAFPELNPNTCMDFNPGAQTDRTLGIKVAPGGTLTVDLQWNEPWEGVTTDLDSFLLDANGNMIAASAEDNVAFSQAPFEFFGWENLSGSQRTVQLVVNRFAGSLPRLKVAFLENGSEDVEAIEYPRSSGTDVVGPTVFGHNGAADAISVGAVPFNDSLAVEEYSSRGPVTHYFGPVEGSLPAAKLGSPEVLSKPDVAATDCGRTTFFAFFAAPSWRFCGTSASAPHTAAIAALMAEAEPGVTPSEIRAALLSSAVEVPAVDECGVGAGLVEAVGAVEDLLTPPSPVELECDPPVAEVPVGEAQAAGSWGVEFPPVQPPTSGQPPESTTTQPNPESQDVDTVPPTTFFRKRPPSVLRTRTGTARAIFRFGSNEAGVAFLCKLEGAPFRPCGRRTVWLGLEPGRHVLRVKARDGEGNVDSTPAVFRFRVERVG
jgi:hypothetical protein